MSGFGEIVRFADRDAGSWPFRDFPAAIEYDGSSWTKTDPFTQLVDFFDPRVVAGYREDVVGAGASRHMVVFQEPGGDRSFVIDHRETNPNHDFVGHAKEVVVDFAKRHPVATAVAIGGLVAVVVQALKK